MGMSIRRDTEYATHQKHAATEALHYLQIPERKGKDTPRVNRKQGGIQDQPVSGEQETQSEKSVGQTQHGSWA